MVPFNVMALGEGRFHRATSGDIVIEHDEAHTAEKLSVPGLTIRPTGNIDGVQWGKLLLNLNNALNALADLPLRRQLAQRPGGNYSPIRWRKAWLRSAPRASSRSRRRRSRRRGCRRCCACRTPIFEALLGRTMKIDPEARSSMWEDLKHGRRTEIDYLQGVITDIAERRGLQAPLSRRIVELIRQAEREAKGSPRPDAGAGSRGELIWQRARRLGLKWVGGAV